MPLDRLWRGASEAQEAALEAMRDGLHEDLMLTYSELETYQTPEWEKLQDVIQAEMDHAYTDMMSGEPEQMVLARERVRAYARLNAKPKELRAKADRLRDELKQLEEE